jgi:hypothetical protein
VVQVAKVSCSSIKTYGSGDVHILAVDCGMKYNIIRSLVSAGIKLTVVPWNHDIKKERYDGTRLVLLFLYPYLPLSLSLSRCMRAEAGCEEGALANRSIRKIAIQCTSS